MYYKLNLFYVILFFVQFFRSNALADESSIEISPKMASYQVAVFSTLGKTNNSSMPTLNGLQLTKVFETFESYLEFSKALYKEEPSISTTVVSGEKVEQKSKLISAVGIKGLILNYVKWDLALDMNQFS